MDKEIENPMVSMGSPERKIYPYPIKAVSDEWEEEPPYDELEYDGWTGSDEN